MDGLISTGKFDGQFDINCKFKVNKYNILYL